MGESGTGSPNVMSCPYHTTCNPSDSLRAIETRRLETGFVTFAAGVCLAKLVTSIRLYSTVAVVAAAVAVTRDEESHLRNVKEYKEETRPRCIHVKHDPEMHSSRTGFSSARVHNASVSAMQESMISWTSA